MMDESLLRCSPNQGLELTASSVRVLRGRESPLQGKDVTEVRSPHRQLLPDTVGPEDQKPTSLRGRANKAKADKRHRLRDLYRCLDAELLLDCWQDLNKEAASGVGHVMADAYAANLQGNLEALVQQLKTKLPLAGGRGAVCSGAAQKAGKIPPPGSSGEDPSATVQPFTEVPRRRVFA